MRTVPISLVAAMLAVSSPGLACITSLDLGELVQFDFEKIDAALLKAKLTTMVREDLVARRAEAERLWLDGTALRCKALGKDREAASSGIGKQFAAQQMAEGLMNDLKLFPLPVRATLGEPACDGQDAMEPKIMLGAKRKL